MPATPAPRRFRNVDRWGPVSQLLHWGIVVLILIVVAGYGRDRRLRDTI